MGKARTCTRIGRLATIWFFATAIAPIGASGQDSTWLAAPGSSAYNVGSNWTTGTVPTGTAIFGASNTTTVALPPTIFAIPPNPTTTIGAFRFDADAPAYTFVRSSISSPPAVLRFTGVGIVNNSSNAPIFDSTGLVFANASGAGNAIIRNNGFLSGNVGFADNATAASATIINDAFVGFSNSSTAGNATIRNNSGSTTSFFDTASAGNAAISTFQNGTTRFRNRSTAGAATLVTTAGGFTTFQEDASAGNATLTISSGFVSFQDRSTAGNAVINVGSGGVVGFGATASGGSARIITDSTSSVLIFGQNTSIGSIEGGGSFFIAGALPSAQLIVGNNGLSTEVSGTISSFSSGSLVKVGAGTLTLSGTNTFTGGLAINSGVIAAARDANLGNGSGSLSFGGGGLQLLTSFNLSATRAIVLNAGGGTIDTNGFGTTISQAITGAGSLTKAGSGTLSLNGASTFTGGTVLNAGNLIVNGSLASGVTVNAGSMMVNGRVAGSSVVNAGILTGGGAVTNLTLNGGAVAPGSSIGTLTISGNFVQNVGSSYQVELNAAGQSDQINIAGAAAINGGTVTFQPQSGNYALNTVYTILSAAAGVSGTFTSIASQYPFLQPYLRYDANNVYLALQAGGFTAAAANPTQYAVGAVLDANASNATGDFAQVLTAMAFNTLSAAQGQATLQALSGNNYAGFSTSMVQGMQLFMNNFANQTGGGGSPVSNRVALAESCDVACDSTTLPKWGAWGGALGGLGTIGANQPVGSVTYNAGGFAAGLDRSITDTFRMGVTAGYTTGTQWVSGFDGLGRTDTFQVGLYGGFSQDKVYADGLIGYAYSWNQMWRNIAIPGLPLRTAQGRTGANQWYGQLETGYRFDLGTNANAFVTPFAQLQAYTGTQNAFTETGAQSLNLTVAQQTTNSLRSVIGAQLGGSMDLGWREKLAMQLRLGWSHEYADVGRPVTATLAGAPVMPFTTFGVAPQRDGVVLGLSANTAIAEATSIYLRYEGDISGQDSAHALTAGVRMTW